MTLTSSLKAQVGEWQREIKELSRPRHIVDMLIQERAPNLAALKVWPLLQPILYKLLGYRDAVRMADAVQGLDGPACFDYVSALLHMQIELVGGENLPREGACMIACNHPTGIADGIILWSALSPLRRDMAIFANRDAVRANPKLNSFIIPVEWRPDFRSREKTRETLKLSDRAFVEQRAVVLFPSGRLAYWDRDEKRIMERPWQPTVVSLARKHQVPIIPVHIDSRNSGLYYLFCRLSNELRDITIFHEILNKRDKSARVIIGEPIYPDKLDNDPNEGAIRLRHYVSETLGKNPEARF